MKAKDAGGQSRAVQAPWCEKMGGVKWPVAAKVNALDRRGSRWNPLHGMGMPADSPGGCANAFIFSPLR